MHLWKNPIPGQKKRPQERRNLEVESPPLGWSSDLSGEGCCSHCLVTRVRVSALSLGKQKATLQDRALAQREVIIGPVGSLLPGGLAFSVCDCGKVPANVSAFALMTNSPVSGIKRSPSYNIPPDHLLRKLNIVLAVKDKCFTEFFHYYRAGIED